MVIWDYDVPAAAKSVGWAVVVNNVEALRILLGVGYFWAGVLALVGALVRASVGGVVLRCVGVGGNGGLEGWAGIWVDEGVRVVWALAEHGTRVARTVLVGWLKKQ